jgi:hypothetical protein
MARSKSIILSKDEKKSVITGLKSNSASAKAAIKVVAAELKAANKAQAVAAKEHMAFVKAKDKLMTALTKELAGYTAQLNAMTAKTL